MGNDQSSRAVPETGVDSGVASASVRPEPWQDIATAPKDGGSILLFCPQGDGNPGSEFRVTVGSWSVDEGGTTEHRDLDGRWIGQDDRDYWEGWVSWDGGFSEDTMMPTHWMPMPKPPSALENGPAGLADANSKGALSAKDRELAEARKHVRQLQDFNSRRELDILEIASQRDEAMAALREIAAQKTVNELCAEFGKCYETDWEGGYDACINRARSVLSSVQPVSGSREQRGNEEGSDADVR